VKSSPTWPDLGMSGYLVLVVRLLAGGSISGVPVLRSGVPFWGGTKNKLAAIDVNVNAETGIFRCSRHIPVLLIVKRFEQSSG
jgi:hypothetical protein